MTSHQRSRLAVRWRRKPSEIETCREVEEEAAAVDEGSDICPLTTMA